MRRELEDITALINHKKQLNNIQQHTDKAHSNNITTSENLITITQTKYKQFTHAYTTITTNTSTTTIITTQFGIITKIINLSKVRQIFAKTNN